MSVNLYMLLTVVFAAVIHSGFSLSTSMLVLLSGHSLSRKRSHARLVALGGGFVLGSLMMILLILATICYAFMLFDAISYSVVPLALGTFAALSGIWVLFFYHRRGDGTQLWLPRPFARYLNERTAHTKNPAESFVLGAAGVLYELPVTIWLLLVAAFSVVSLSAPLQVTGIIGYSIIGTVSLLIVFMLIGGGHSPSAITRFRTQHKWFIQALVGLSLLLLGASVFWNNFYVTMATNGVSLW